jgi:hypothetical protein
VYSYIRCFCCIEGDDLEVIWYHMHVCVEFRHIILHESWLLYWMMIVDDECVWWIHTCDIWSWLVDELCHIWICDLVNCALVKFGECCDYVDCCICALVDFVDGCEWMIYALLRVLPICTYTLGESIDDDYFNNNDEVRIVYVYTYDVVISLMMMITCL